MTGEAKVEACRRFVQLTPSYAAQIQPPINADGTSVFSSRRGVVPVKFTLTEAVLRLAIYRQQRLL